MKSALDKKKPKKLATKLTGYIALCAFVVFSILITVNTISTRSDLVVRESEKLSLLADKNANISKSFMETMVFKQDVIIDIIKNLDDVALDERITLVSDIVSDTKASNSDILSLFVVSEPGYFGEDTPNGYSIFSTDKGTKFSKTMFDNVIESVYNNVKSRKIMTIADPMKKTIDGIEYTVITVMKPILDKDQNVLGMVGSNINLDLLNNASYDTGGYQTFNNEIICGHQVVIANTHNREIIGKKFADSSISLNKESILESAQDEGALFLLDEHSDGEKYYKSFTPFKVAGSDVVWLSGTSISESEFNKTIFSQIIAIVLVSIGCLIVLTLFVFIFINKALKPIGVLEKAAKGLSEGNLHSEINFDSNDELGSLARSLKESFETLYSYVRDIDRAMAQMADGDFNIRPSQPFIGDFKGIEDSITTFIIRISSALTQIKDSVNDVSVGAETVSGSAQILAQGSAEQASSIEELSASVFEISSKVNESAKNSEKARDMANGATDAITNSNSQMQELLAAMNEINSQSGEIGKIIKTIEDISFQTNILALNAAVEAARAGAAGKGFAVVADEVRNLANKSNEAAKSTAALIEASIRSVAKGSALANQTAENLVSVVDGAHSTTAFISQISSATAQQAELLNQITTNIDQISTVIQTNSATSQESAATAEELNSHSAVMKSLVSAFKVKE